MLSERPVPRKRGSLAFHRRSPGERTLERKERLQGLIQPDRDVRHDLRMDTGQSGACGLERGQRRLLVRPPSRLLPLLPGVAPLRELVVVQPATRLPLGVEEALLLLGRVQAARERLTYDFTVCLRRACSQASGAIHHR